MMRNGMMHPRYRILYYDVAQRKNKWAYYDGKSSYPLLFKAATTKRIFNGQTPL